MERAAVACLVVAIALAGCVGSSSSETGDEPGATDGANDTAEPDAPEGETTTLRFASEQTNANDTWTGTFQVQEACNTGGCPTGSFQRPIEIQDLVPAGTPTRVHVNLTYDVGPGSNVHGDEMELWFSSQGTSYYEFDYEEPQRGRISVTTDLLRSEGSLSVVLAAYFPDANPDPNVDYTLEVATRSLNDTVAPEMPVTVQAAPGDRITAETVGDGSVALAVYGPDDSYLGNVTGEGPATTTLPANASTGAYVLVAESSSAPLRLSTTGNATTMTALGYAFEAGDWRDVPPNGAASWEFSVDTTPLTVGLSYRSSHPAGFGPFVGQDVAWNVTLPSGGWIGCSSCTYIGFGGVWTGASTGIRPGMLDPGAYTLNVDSTVAFPFQVREFVAHYAR